MAARKKPSKAAPAGKPDPAAPPPSDVALAPEVIEGVVREIFPAPEDEPAGLAYLDGTPDLLDVLDQLPTTHPERAAIRVRCSLVEADGVGAIVPFDWGHRLPTVDHLAQLVSTNRIPPGDYRVLVMRGRVKSRPITMRISQPVNVRAATPDASAGHSETFAERALASLLTTSPGFHGFGQPGRAQAVPSEVTEVLTLLRRDQSEARARMDRLEEDVGECVTGIAGINAAIQHVATSMQESGGSDWADVLRDWIASQNKNGAAEESGEKKVEVTSIGNTRG